MLNAKSILLAIAAATIAFAPASAQPEPARVSVTIDTEHPGARIEPAIYGQFAEHLGRGIYEGIWVGEGSAIPNTSGYRNDVLAALRRLRVPVIRWPGGCFADDYDWRDGIGPRDRRPARINVHWGGVIEDNSFGTHEFMNYTELLGADAYVAGNMGSLPPRSMAQWFEYMTSSSRSSLAEERRRNGREQPWRVPYFGVGNESWGCGGNMRPEYSADLHRRYQTFISARWGTPPVIRVATGANVDDYNFTEVMMREAARHMNALSIHYYTFPGSWERKGARHRLRRGPMGLDPLPCAAHGRAGHPAQRDHGPLRSGAADRPLRRRMGHLVRCRARLDPGLPLPAEFAARRRGGGADAQHLPPPHRAGEARRHRPDGQRAPGDDPHRRAEDAADADLSRLRHVPAVQGRDALSGAGRGTALPLRRRGPADGRRLRRARRRRPPLPRSGEPRSEPAGAGHHRPRRHRPRADPHRAGDGHPQHVRRARHDPARAVRRLECRRPDRLRSSGKIGRGRRESTTRP